MRLRKRTRTIVAMLLILCVVIVVALNAQAPVNMPSHPAKKTAEHTTNQPAPVGNAERPTAPPALDSSTSETARPYVPVAQAEEPTQTNDSVTDPSATSGAIEASEVSNAPEPADVPEADEDASSMREEIQRQAAAVIPHVEQPTVDPNVEYEPGVVLVSVRKGTTAEQFSQAMAGADIRSVEHDGVEVVTDGLMMATLAPNVTIDDAIYELESTGVAQVAQPNYVYQIAGEQVTSLDETEPATAATTAQGEGEASDAIDASAPKTSDELHSTAEENAAEA